MARMKRFVCSIALFAVLCGILARTVAADDNGELAIGDENVDLGLQHQTEADGQDGQEEWRNYNNEHASQEDAHHDHVADPVAGAEANEAERHVDANDLTVEAPLGEHEPQVVDAAAPEASQDDSSAAIEPVALESVDAHSQHESVRADDIAAGTPAHNEDDVAHGPEPTAAPEDHMESDNGVPTEPQGAPEDADVGMQTTSGVAEVTPLGASDAGSTDNGNDNAASESGSEPSGVNVDEEYAIQQQIEQHEQDNSSAEPAGSADGTKNDVGTNNDGGVAAAVEPSHDEPVQPPQDELLPEGEILAAPEEPPASTQQHDDALSATTDNQQADLDDAPRASSMHEASAPPLPASSSSETSGASSRSSVLAEARARAQAMLERNWEARLAEKRRKAAASAAASVGKSAAAAHASSGSSTEFWCRTCGAHVTSADAHLHDVRLRGQRVLGTLHEPELGK